VHPTTPGKALRLRITDDGQGCAAEMIKTGFGLLGMRERIDIPGGELTIQTRPQQGISVIVKYSIEMKKRIKVILTDDHGVVRAGFRMLLSTEN